MDKQLRRGLTALSFHLLAATPGLVLGYDFGVRAGGGVPMGVVSALCAGVFCSLLADAAAMRWRAWRSRDREHSVR